MTPHIEIASTRSVADALGERVWGWEIPVYLFLGGLVAGILVAVSVAALVRGPAGVSRAMRNGLVLAPVLLSLGMLSLFVDLSYKLHVFRFYTAFRPSAPMWWGAWVLVLIYPVQVALIAALPPDWLEPKLQRVTRLRSWLRLRLRAIAAITLCTALLLGVYTGVLLSATGAHPLWTSGALGALFLVSGLSTGTALLMLMEKDDAAHHALARADVILVGVELLILALWLLALLAQGPLAHAAALLLLSGPYAPAFLGFVVFGGLLVPAALELLALANRARRSPLVPGLVLAGGLLLRFVVVYAGQIQSFVRA